MSLLEFEHQVKLPGPFTVLQGLDGDGLDNTVDSCPTFDLDNSNSNSNDETATALAVWDRERRTRQTNEASEWLQMTRYQQTGSKSSVPILTSLTAGRWWLHEARLRVFSSLPEGGAEPPASDDDDESTPTLPPGSVVQGRSLHTFEKCGEDWISRGHISDCPTGMLLSGGHCPKAGRIQYLELESPIGGSEYVLFSVDGYAVLASGTPDQPLFTSSLTTTATTTTTTTTTGWWWWKVTCAAGAVIRQTSDLKSPVLATVPYGAHLQVMKKVINREGLARLRVRTTATQKQTVIEGWCSHLLNPLSGQRGFIVQPIPPAVPVFYQVVLSTGAVIRQGLELSTPVVAQLPLHTIVSVLGRAFTSTTDCIPRLRLAHNQAYASARLNTAATATTAAGTQTQILRPTGQIDTSFDTSHPGLYHHNAYQKWAHQRIDTTPHSSPRTQQQALSSPFSLSSSSSSPRLSTPSSSAVPHQTPICVCCMTNEANATVIHGETGHICCCLECARLCQAQAMGCPLCRKRIDRVILHFYS